MRNQKGVTLVILIITIAVILILVGATMSTLLDDGKALKQSSNLLQKTENKIEQNDEKVNNLIEKLNEIIEVTKKISTLVNVAVTENTKAEDAYGNKITIPKGFKVLPNSTGTTTGDVTYSYSGDNVPAVQDGIVIEDTQEGTAGNQFVWVPVGTIKNKNNTTTTITLGRYSDFTMTNGEVASGQPVQVASLTNYTQEVVISTYYKELSTFREGNTETGANAQNATARDLKTFIETSLANGGYYIARYEAGITGTTDNYLLSTNTATDGSVKPQSKYGLGVWNSINQPNAAKVARAMYGEVKDASGNLLYASDLVNSYAWDTAIIFIQKMGNSNYANETDASGTENNTGVSGDVKCNIYDMAKNMREFTTEYSSDSITDTFYPCTLRGGDFIKNSSGYVAERVGDYTCFERSQYCFRSLLYVSSRM